VLGKYFVLTGGWAIGNVAGPPVGQQLGQAPMSDNALTTLSSRVSAKPFFGVGFTWIDRRDQFANALSSLATASGQAVVSCVKGAPAEATIDAGKDTAEVTIEAPDDCSWTATVKTGGDKFTLDPATGKGKQTVTIKAKDKEAAEGTIDIVGPAGAPAKTVKVKRAAPPPSCVSAVDPADLTFEDDEKKQLTIKATSECEWKAAFEGASNGFQLDKAEDKGEARLTVTPPAQGSGEFAAAIRVTGPAGAVPVTVKVKQQKQPASCITKLTPETLTFGAARGTLSIEVKAACAWTATLAPAGIGFTLPTASGSGDGTVTVMATPAGTSDRAATVTLTGPPRSAPKTVALVQPKRPERK